MRNNRPFVPGPRLGSELSGRKVLLGVCGGIAAYKAVELSRLLIKAGIKVQVIMTEAATKFVTPLTFETITGRAVFIEMFAAHGDASPWHTELATWADMAVVAPATANTMARLAGGFADDLLSTIMLTLERPRLLCPSMNHRMWANSATQDNVNVLKRRGYRMMMPDAGHMARPGEGDGMGRLPEPETIFREISHILSAPRDLQGVRVLVTAGRTEESWDPVRVLTNRATGRMGFALAEEAHERGADVVLIHGPTDVIPPAGPRVRRVVTAAEMAHAFKQEFGAAKVVLMAAAVADYTFAQTAEHKIKKGGPDPELHLVATEDILRSVAPQKGHRVIVGFALETENLLENALRKLREKHLDIVVANNPLQTGSGFAGDTNQVLIIHRSGKVNELPLQSKREVARELLNTVIHIYRHPEPEPETELTDEPEDVEEPVMAVEPVIALPKVAEPVAEQTTIDLPSSQPETKKSSRGRRGGRRSARARARKAAEIAAQQTPETPAPEKIAPPVEVKPAPTPKHKPAAPAPTAKKEPVVKTEEPAAKKPAKRSGRPAGRPPKAAAAKTKKPKAEKS